MTEFYRNQRFTVTDANVAPHHFPVGTVVTLQRVSTLGDRYLVRGKTPEHGTIVQWLAIEDLAEVAPEEVPVG